MSNSITYGTKEEHNHRREQEFLKLSYADRLVWFLNAVSQLNSLPTQHKKNRINYFVIDKNGASF